VTKKCNVIAAYAKGLVKLISVCFSTSFNTFGGLSERSLDGEKKTQVQFISNQFNKPIFKTK